MIRLFAWARLIVREPGLMLWIAQSYPGGMNN